MDHQLPYIPLELIQVIVEQLVDSKATLRVCALVCNAWLPIAFRVLFYRFTVRVYAMSDDDLHKLHAGHIFPHYVSCLNIRNSPGRGISPATFEGILSLFDHATRISMTHYELGPIAHLGFLHQTHPHLRELELMSTSFTSVRSLQTFIAAFSHLEHLSVSFFGMRFEPTDTDNHNPNHRPPPPRLSNLAYKFSDAHRTSFLRWLSDNQPTIQHLILRSLSIDELEPAAALLRAIGPHLRSLDISFRGTSPHQPQTPTRLPLQSNIHLHTLHISRIPLSFAGPIPRLCIPPTLLDSTCPTIRCIAFQLEPSDTTDGPAGSLRWDEFDAMLARRVPALECLHVRVIDKRLYEHSPFMRSVLGARMTWCSRRGALRGMDMAINHRELGVPLHERLPLVPASGWVAAQRVQ
ncbi:hypothetical protein BD779DRAFT_119044 [Infundibulicybe gibba]|nr:hypothetical protein BD779DRAFT_119044 [Infundibulicybe gibba]